MELATTLMICWILVCSPHPSVVSQHLCTVEARPDVGRWMQGTVLRTSATSRASIGPSRPSVAVAVFQDRNASMTRDGSCSCGCFYANAAFCKLQSSTGITCLACLFHAIGMVPLVRDIFRQFTPASKPQIQPANIVAWQPTVICTSKLVGRYVSRAAENQFHVLSCGRLSRRLQFSWWLLGYIRRQSGL